jgi:hypothetical protein
MKVDMWPEPSKAMGPKPPQLPSWYVQELEHGILEHSLPLKYNIVFPIQVKIHFGPVAPLFFPVSLFWTGNVCSLPVSPLYFGNV